MTDPILFETDHFTARQAPTRLPGYVILDSKVDCSDLAALAPDAAADLMQCLREAERIVRALVAPERVYTLRFGEVQPRIHFHVVPRTARVAESYTAAVDDPAPHNGARLVDWLWEHHADLGHSDADLAAFVAQARALAQRAAP